MQSTQVKNCTPESVFLAVALELSAKRWKIAVHDGKRAENGAKRSFALAAKAKRKTVNGRQASV